MYAKNENHTAINSLDIVDERILQSNWLTATTYQTYPEKPHLPPFLDVWEHEKNPNDLSFTTKNI